MTDKEMAKNYALERQKNLHLSQRDTNLIHLAYLHGLKAVQDINRKFNLELRDLFAMSAMNALLQRLFGCIEDVAEQSYRIANAMLKVSKEEIK